MNLDKYVSVLYLQQNMWRMQYSKAQNIEFATNTIFPPINVQGYHW